MPPLELPFRVRVTVKGRGYLSWGFSGWREVCQPEKLEGPLTEAAGEKAGGCPGDLQTLSRLQQQWKGVRDRWEIGMSEATKELKLYPATIARLSRRDHNGTSPSPHFHRGRKWSPWTWTQSDSPRDTKQVYAGANTQFSKCPILILFTPLYRSL